MNKIILFIKRVSFVIFPLFIVSFMSTNEWIARSQMIDNNMQKEFVYNTVVLLDNKLHKKEVIPEIILKEQLPKEIEKNTEINSLNIASNVANEEIYLNTNLESKKEIVSELKLEEKKDNVKVNKEKEGDFKRVLLVGDSLMAEIAFGLKDQMSKTISLKDIHKSSTGLTNKDYYDWDTVAYKAALNYSPDLIFIHMGGNDGQDMKVGNKFVKLYTREWEDNYYNRVVALISSVKKGSPNAQIVWIGLPGMRDQKYEKKTAIIRETQKRGSIDSNIEFLDAGDAIGHNYMKQEKINGKMLDLRRKDGIHYSRDGGEQIASFIINKKNIEKR